MQTLLNNLKNSFPGYHDQVNQIFRKNTREWDDLFSPEDPDIFRGVLFIIKKFLEADDKRRLFIRFPSERIGRSNESKKSNITRLECLIADVLYLATKPSWEKEVACPSIIDAKIGDTFFTDYLDGTVWVIKESKVDGAPRPSAQDKGFRTPEARQLFDELRNQSIRILDGWQDVSMRRLASYAKQINLYRSLPDLAGYSSSILVGFNPSDWGNRPINVELFPPSVRMTSNFDKLNGQSCDLLVFVGERKYRNFAREISNSVAEGIVKKVVMIGSDPLDGFGSEDYDVSYSFSFREMFTYFAGGKFPEIFFRKIRFKWLEDKLDQLVGILPDYLEEYDRKRIVRATITPFLQIEMASTKSNYLKKFLESDFDYTLSPEQIEQIVTWQKENRYQTETPKQQTNKLIVSRGTKLVFSVPGDSFIRQVGDLVRNHNRPKNDIVIDALNDGKKIVEAIKALLQNCCLGKYHILSYFELPTLFRFFNDEIKAYNDPQRVALLNVRFSVQSASSDVVSSNLLDYFDASSDELLSMIAGSSQAVRQTEYLATFDSLDSELLANLCGEVIRYNEIIQVEDLYTGKDDYLPCMITFYEKPENYQILMELYYNFPKGQTVADMSELWKRKMRSLFSDRYQGNLDAMQRDFLFMARSKLRSIVNGRYQSMFPDEIKKIAEKLLAMGVVSRNECAMIQAAPNVVGKNSTRAQELKSALLEYRVTGKIGGILKRIIDHSEDRGEPLTVQEIADASLETRELWDIQKIKNNRNANG